MNTVSTDSELRPLGPTALAPFAESPGEALRSIFGFDSFRQGQQRAIDALEAGHDALVVMPTGSGKSLCYQLGGALMDGVTLVVSPLIALMKDQVDALKRTGLPATEINSSMSRSEQQRRIEGLYCGDYKIVYVAPERFRSPTFREALSKVKIGLFAIDEAHCISQWGHDFRPDYRRLSAVRKQFGNPQTVALTATATEFVQKDILEQLELPDAKKLVSGFERPNLCFEVFHAQGKQDKLRRTKALIDHYEDQSALIYGATRKQVRKVQEALVDDGFEAGLYHGGLSDAKRKRIQERWMADEQPVLVTTNAFGMGVDKPDVRAVIHYNMPGSIEAYYQEAGRAGRDGEPAHCLLLFNYADTGIHEWFADNSFPLMTEVVRVWMYLQNLGLGEHDLTPSAISQATKSQGGKIHPMAVETCLRHLSAGGHLKKRGKTIEILERVEPNELNIEYEWLEQRRHIQKEQISHVVDYANTSSCFQASLLEHFGDQPSFGRSCGNCSACDPPPAYVENQAEQLAPTLRTSDPPVTVVEKVLSGIARASGRRGATAVAGMLVGSRAKAVKEAGFTELSTYGVLAQLRKKDASYLIDLCARHNLVRRNQYGCVLLSSKGAKVMRGQDPPEALLEFLNTCIHSGANETSQTASTSGRSSSSSTYRKTHQLLERGLGVAEIANERGLTERTIRDHLIRLAADGASLDLEPDPEKLEQLKKIASNWEAGDKLRPLKKKLPQHWSYPVLKTHLAALLEERN